MQDRPTSVELLATLAEYLEALMADLEGPLQYRTRVALNLTKVVGRELEGERAHLLAERGRLQAVLGGASAEIDERIELREEVGALNQALFDALMAGSGDVDERLWDALMATTQDKLAVVRPGYDDYDGSVERPQ
jgi:hypothetical protein